MVVNSGKNVEAAVSLVLDKCLTTIYIKTAPQELEIRL